jgi:hypothetical protein
MTAETDVRPSPSPARLTQLIIPLAVGAAVSVTLGMYGRLHSATGIAVTIPGFSGPKTLKVWMATAAIIFALVQLLTATVMYGKVRAVAASARVATVHRWSGRIAFLLSVPVAVHCLYALGFQTLDVRVVAHSLLGCLFYGVFTTKMLLLTRSGLAGWALPVVGGLAFAGVVGLWITSALWYFATFGVQL